MNEASTQPQRANYYYLSNDALNLTRIVADTSINTLLGVANADFLHVLGAVAASNAPLQQCTVFDNNSAQLEHMGKLFELIQSSSDRYDYLEKLFCMRFGKHARQALHVFEARKPWQIPGAEEGAGFIEFERMLWRDIHFDSLAFESRTKLKAEITEKGLMLHSNVVGGMEKLMLTILCMDTSNFEHTPFSVRFGHGYLGSDKVFSQTKALLEQVKPRLIHLDAAHDLIPLLLAHRYERTLLWASNIFTPYFLERYPALHETASEIIRLSTRTKELPQMDLGVIADTRIAGPLTGIWLRGRWQRWRMTPHFKAFSEVRRWLLDGPAIEIVNVPSWVDQDNGLSKLPATRYVLLDEFLKSGAPQQFNTAFLHILLGHGANEKELQDAFAKAKLKAKRVLVLEHNSHSFDFLGRRNLPTLQRIIQLLNQPDYLVAVPGTRSFRRNWLLVYEQSTHDGTP